MNSHLRNLLLVVLVGGLLFLLWPRKLQEAELPAADSVATPSAAPAPEAVDAESRRDGAPGRASSQGGAGADNSLRGTDVAGGLLVDADGNFVPGPETVAMFEHFLSTTGEKPADAILADIRAEIATRLDPPADAQALAFLERYMPYRERGIALGLTDVADENLRARFERLKALRREIFGEEVAARLFGEEEAQAEVAIRQREVEADPELTAEQKAAQIEKLYDQLPSGAREAREQAMEAIRLREDEGKIRARGGGDQEIRELRVERFGEEAADRLEDLDRERAQWDTRFRDYRTARARILGDPALTEAARRAALERLLDDRFEDNEKVRARALDSLEDEQGKAAQ